MLKTGRSEKRHSHIVLDLQSSKMKNSIRQDLHTHSLRSAGTLTINRHNAEPYTPFRIGMRLNTDSGRKINNAEEGYESHQTYWPYINLLQRYSRSGHSSSTSKTERHGSVVRNWEVPGSNFRQNNHHHEILRFYLVPANKYRILA